MSDLISEIGGFNADEHEGMTEFALIEPGEYRAQIISAESKNTKAETGKYLALTFELLDHPNEGRRLWVNLNLKNPSKQAVQIAESELTSICEAIDKTKIDSSDDLIGQPMMIKVGVNKRKDNGELQNRVKKYMRIGNESPSEATPASGGKPDWA